MASTTDKKKKGIMNLIFKTEEIQDTSPSIPDPITTGIPIVAQEDSKIKEQLSSALLAANIEGYDYFEFAQATEAQATFIPSEALRYQTTFASAKVTSGVTLEKLLNSNQHYLDVLKKKETEFNQAMEGHTAQTITSKTEAIAKLDADMKAKADEITRITAEINSIQQQKTSMTNEISKSQSDIAQIKTNFDATMRVFVDRLTSDRDKIKNYLKTV